MKNYDIILSGKRTRINPLLSQYKNAWNRKIEIEKKEIDLKC